MPRVKFKQPAAPPVISSTESGGPAVRVRARRSTALVIDYSESVLSKRSTCPVPTGPGQKSSKRNKQRTGRKEQEHLPGFGTLGKRKREPESATKVEDELDENEDEDIEDSDNSSDYVPSPPRIPVPEVNGRRRLRKPSQLSSYSYDEVDELEEGEVIRFGGPESPTPKSKRMSRKRIRKESEVVSWLEKVNLGEDRHPSETTARNDDGVIATDTKEDSTPGESTNGAPPNDRLNVLPQTLRQSEHWSRTVAGRFQRHILHIRYFHEHIQPAVVLMKMKDHSRLCPPMPFDWSNSSQHVCSLNFDESSAAIIPIRPAEHVFTPFIFPPLSPYYYNPRFLSNFFRRVRDSKGLNNDDWQAYWMVTSFEIKGHIRRWEFGTLRDEFPSPWDEDEMKRYKYQYIDHWRVWCDMHKIAECLWSGQLTVEREYMKRAPYLENQK